jgi:hypothetical protein
MLELKNMKIPKYAVNITKKIDFFLNQLNYPQTLNLKKICNCVEKLQTRQEDDVQIKRRKYLFFPNVRSRIPNFEQLGFKRSCYVDALSSCFLNHLLLYCTASN